MNTDVAAPRVGFASSHISVQTRAAPDFIDITEEVERCMEAAGLRQGLAVVASQHTTAGIVVNEHEPELLKDLSRLLCEIAPPSNEYAHNVVPCGPDEVPNAHAHCQALLLQTSASIPIASGLLMLGRYQRIFLVELDHPRHRVVTVTLLGT
jgi:secondary thiamine-phosphate synthase enzyme